MGGRAELQSFCSPQRTCLGAFCLKRWFNLIRVLWLSNEVIHSQQVPCSDELAGVTHVYINCVNAVALPARSSCSVHFIVNGLTLSSLNAKGRFFWLHGPYVSCSSALLLHLLRWWGWDITCISTGWTLLPFASKVQSSSLVSIKVQLFRTPLPVNTSNMRTSPSNIFFPPNMSYSATQEFSNLGSP